MFTWDLDGTLRASLRRARFAYPCGSSPDVDGLGHECAIHEREPPDRCDERMDARRVTRQLQRPVSWTRQLPAIQRSAASSKASPVIAAARVLRTSTRDAAVPPAATRSRCRGGALRASRLRPPPGRRVPSGNAGPAPSPDRQRSRTASSDEKLRGGESGCRQRLCRALHVRQSLTSDFALPRPRRLDCSVRARGPLRVFRVTRASRRRGRWR